MPTRQRAPRGHVIYRGPSELDGAPIVAIATLATSNRKTGPMIQTWILRDDVAPHEAQRNGADVSVCGDCPHRPLTYRAAGAARCYVTTFQAPLAVYRAFHSGAYPEASVSSLPAIAEGRPLRIGSYGDPAAVPVFVWSLLAQRASGITGYTHQWRAFPSLRPYCMASVDSTMEHAAAEEQGWRTFRVKPVGEDMNTHREVTCPASVGDVTCASCLLCNAGRAAKSVAIMAH